MTACSGMNMADNQDVAVAERPSLGWRLAPAPACAPAVARAGDAGELALRDALLRFVDGRLRDRIEGEDIVQETYLRFYHYRRSRPVADVASFCFAVARNLVFDHLRRLRVQRPAVELDETIVCPQPRAEEIFDYRQRVDIMEQALRGMPPLRREVFLRRRLDGIPAAVIATDLDLSPAAIEKHCSRALADLRHALERRGLGLGPRG